MGNVKLELEKMIEVTEKLFHECYRGNLEPWFSYLYAGSIYIGNGDPILVGQDVIRRHFASLSGIRQEHIIKEEYHGVQLSNQICNVYGQLLFSLPDSPYSVISRFTLTYRIVGDQPKIVHQQNSYEYRMGKKQGKENPVAMTVDMLRLVQSLISRQTEEKKLAVPVGNHTVMISPHMISYIHSCRKRCEVICLDRKIACTCSMTKLAEHLPDTFYPIHRSYLINTRYVADIRRFEVELTSGEILPIPEKNYTRVKKDLTAL